jgi:hypothetical protein
MQFIEKQPIFRTVLFGLHVSQQAPLAAALLFDVSLQDHL